MTNLISLSNLEPFSGAILATAVVEHELEQSLRGLLPRKDDHTWNELLGEHGIFSTFALKIQAGHAFKLYDDVTRDNLNVIRRIRNGFAHARVAINFGDPLVIEELRKVRIPGRGTKSDLRTFREISVATSDFQKHFAALCIYIAYPLLKRRYLLLYGRRRRAEKRAGTLEQKANELARENPAMTGYMSALIGGFAPMSANPLAWIPPLQSGDPTTEEDASSHPKRRDQSA